MSIVRTIGLNKATRHKGNYSWIEHTVVATPHLQEHKAEVSKIAFIFNTHFKDKSIVLGNDLYIYCIALGHSERFIEHVKSNSKTLKVIVIIDTNEYTEIVFRSDYIPFDECEMKRHFIILWAKQAKFAATLIGDQLPTVMFTDISRLIYQQYAKHDKFAKSWKFVVRLNDLVAIRVRKSYFIYSEKRGSLIRYTKIQTPSLFSNVPDFGNDLEVFKRLDKLELLTI